MTRMSSTELAIREKREIVRLDTEQIQYIANTEFVPTAMRGNLPAIFACIATGREIGIGDMAALRHIHVIDGKPGYSAEIMVVLVRRAGHSITGTTSDTGATVTGRRGDNGDEITFTFDAAMAERAGLLGKQNWRKYPEAMYWARAVSQVCRMLFADCFAGATYTPDELEGDPLKGSAYDGQQPEELEAGEPQAESADLLSGSSVSQAVRDEPASPASKPTKPTKPTKKQIDFLNMAVGVLREAGRLETDWLWDALDRHDEMLTDGVDSAMVSHWSPLRDRITRDEASRLYELLRPMLDDPNAVWAAGSSTTGEPQADPATRNRAETVSQDAIGEPASRGLSMTELKRNVADFGVSAEAGQEVMARLFPGRQTSDLTDEERLKVWLELQPLKASVGGD